MLSFWNREAVEVEVVNMLEDHLGAVSYPIDIDLLASRMDITMVMYPEDTLSYERHLCMNASPDAFTLCTPTFEYACVYFNNQVYSDTRVKFSKAHEIGHVYLEHVDIFDNRAEDEANYFVGYLLAPHPLIGHYRLEEEISSAFDVGSWCADVSREQYRDRCRMGGPLKEHESRLLSIACIKTRRGWLP